MSNLLSGYSGLILGLLRLSIADWVTRGDTDAREWLLSDDCRNWLEECCLAMNNDMDVLEALALLYEKLGITPIVNRLKG